MFNQCSLYEHLNRTNFHKKCKFYKVSKLWGYFNITNLIHLEFIFAWTMRSKSRSGSLNHSKTKCDCAAGFLFAELKGHFWNPTFPIFFFFFFFKKAVLSTSPTQHFFALRERQKWGFLKIALGVRLSFS